MSEKEYRQFKASGISHKFQRDICQKKFDELNFASIGGRVINNLIGVNKKGTSFMERWNLEERYMKWLDSQNSINFVGYPYELYKKYNMEPVKDYEPDAVMDVYYSKLAGAAQITRSRSDSSVVRDIRRVRASAPPVSTSTLEEESSEIIDDSLRTYHLRETGCLFTTRLPSYQESLT